MTRSPAVLRSSGATSHHCQGARFLRIDSRNLEFQGDAISAEDGCEIHITNSRIAAKVWAFPRAPPTCTSRTAPSKVNQAPSSLRRCAGVCGGVKLQGISRGSPQRPCTIWAVMSGTDGAAAAVASASVQVRESLAHVCAASDFIAARSPPILVCCRRSSSLRSRAHSCPRRFRRARTAVPSTTTSVAEADWMADLRRWRRREFVRIAWRDLASWAPLAETLADLSAVPMPRSSRRATLRCSLSVHARRATLRDGEAQP